MSAYSSSMHGGVSAAPVVTCIENTRPNKNNSSWTNSSSHQEAWTSQNTPSSTEQYNRQGSGMSSSSSANAGVVMEPARTGTHGTVPVAVQSSNSTGASSTTSSQEQPAKSLSAAQLLQFVGLPTNLAEHLTPQNYEKKRRVRQKPMMMPPVMPVPTSNRARPPPGVNSRLSLVGNNNIKCAPVVPKPAVPLPPNLIDGLPGAHINTTSSTTTTLFKSVQRTPTVQVMASNNSPRSILTSTSHTVSAKRMTLKDYKSREEVNKDSTCNITNSSTTNLYNTVPKPKISNTNSMSDIASNNTTTFTESQTIVQDGFVIPNKTNIPDSSKVNHGNNNKLPVLEMNKYNIACGSDNIMPQTDKDGFVIPNANNIPDHTKHSMDELEDASSCDDELVIDECTAMKPTCIPPTMPTTTEEDPPEEEQPSEEKYEVKSALEINEIGNELNELYESLTTDGSLLMDRKMRKKLKKLLRKQKRREKRSSMDVEDDSLELYPEVRHDRHCADDVEDLECSSSANEEDSEESKFKSLKHKNIVRKYRQRELEEDKRMKRAMAGKEPLSDGELSEEGELSSTDDEGDEQSIKQPEKPVPYSDFSFSDSDWVDEMPRSPNELQITFTVQRISTSALIKVSRVATIAERAGGFKGREHLEDSFMDIFKSDKNSSKSQPVDGSSSVSGGHQSDVIEIYAKESFLDNGNVEEKNNGEEGLLPDSEEEFDNGKWHRKTSKSSRHSRHGKSKKRRKHKSGSQSPHRGSRDRKKHSKSRSPSPYEHYKERRHRERKTSPGLSPKRRRRSRSKSPRRKHRTRSRSNSPSMHKRSRSPSKEHEYRWDKQRSDTRSQSDSHKTSNSDNKSSRTRRSPSDDTREPLTAKSTSTPDCNLEEHNMDISSGNETPPLTIANGPNKDDEAADAEVSRQLEEAMEKLEKMEQDVSRRQMIIEDLESKSQNSQASDDESRDLPRKPEDVTVAEEPDEDMDDQLLDAVHRLQKMEENYSRRQMLLDNLRKTMLETEKEFKAADPDLMNDGEDDGDYVEEIPVDPRDAQKATASPHRGQPRRGGPSTSGWKAASPNPTSSKSSHPVKFTVCSSTTTLSTMSISSPPPPKKAPPPPKRSRWDKKAPSPPKRSRWDIAKDVPPKQQESAIKSSKTIPSTSDHIPSNPGPSRSHAQSQPMMAHHKSMPSAVIRTPHYAVRSPRPIPSLLGLSLPPRQGPLRYRPPLLRTPHHSLIGSRVDTRPGILGQHPMTRHSSGIRQQVPPQVPPSQASSSPARPPINTTNLQQQVWLIGSSVLCQAARYVAQGPVGLGLMLNQAELVWHGHDTLKWAEFGQLLTQLIVTSNPPNVLLVHMDALELASSSFQVLAQQAVESLLEFDRRNPNCRIIWSETLPCFHYPGTIAQMTMEQVRINYNVMCSKLVLSLGGQVIKHTDIKPETPALFDKDKMHLSDLGNNIFLNNLRRGLAYLLCEPDTKIYCATDSRTF